MQYTWSALTSRPVLALTALAGALGVAAGCVVLNSEHCAYAGTACGDGLECSMCAIDNNGCVPAGSITDDKCIPAAGTTEPGTMSLTTTTETSTTEGPPTTDTTFPTFPTTTEPTTVDTTDPVVTETETTPGTDPSTDTTVGPECDEAEGVVNNPKCTDGTLPYCKVDTCVSCEGIDCEDVDADKPTCEPNSGVCVQCLVNSDCTQASAPYCDQDTALCKPCTQHDQCAGTACNLESGECFPPENILYVRNSPGCDDQGPGTDMAVPLCTLQTALGIKIDPGVPTTIKVRPGSSPQALQAGLKDGNYIVAIVPFDAQSPSLVVPAGIPALDVAPGNTVFVLQLNIFNSGVPFNDPAIQCNGAKLWLDRLKVYNTKRPMRANNCEVHVRRVAMTSNSSGGVDIDGTMASLKMENSYVTNNGGTFGGVRLMNDAVGEILYSTIALNTANASAVACLNADDLVVRNSVLVAPVGNMPLACGQDITNIKANANSQADATQLFSSFTGGEFKANENGDLNGAAIWKEGDPSGDYDSNGVRPTREGADFAGADVP